MKSLLMLLILLLLEVLFILGPQALVTVPEAVLDRLLDHKQRESMGVVRRI